MNSLSYINPRNHHSGDVIFCFLVILKRTEHYDKLEAEVKHGMVSTVYRYKDNASYILPVRWKEELKNLYTGHSYASLFQLCYGAVMIYEERTFTEAAKFTAH